MSESDGIEKTIKNNTDNVSAEPIETKKDVHPRGIFPYPPPPFRTDEGQQNLFKDGNNDRNLIPPFIPPHGDTQPLNSHGGQYPDRPPFGSPDDPHHGLNNDNPPPLTPMMLINEISKLFRNRIRDENMQNSYRMLLFHLAIRGGRTQLELANMTHLKPPTISVTLQKMESDGYVRRVTNERDMRQTLVYLTEKGEEYNNNIRKKIDVLDKQLTTGFSDEELYVLITLLMKIRMNFHQDDDQHFNPDNF
jgi:Transcriptional regulators